MDVRFYTFNKRENSTAAPSKSGGTLVQCQLLDNTSFQNPRLRLRRDDTIFSYNYFYIPIYDRFYFRSDIESDHTDLIISGTVDPMASFRDAILGSNQYVLRSASKYDSWILDDYYPVTTNVYKQTSKLSDIRTVMGSGCYILKTIGPDGLCIYKTTYGVVKALLTFLISQCNLADTSSMTNVDDVAIAVWKAGYNPFQYILECYYVPFALSSGTADTIKLGAWDSGLNAELITPTHPPTESNVGTLYFNRHPWTQSYAIGSGEEGHFLNMPPFTNFYIESPLFGTIQIPPDIVNDQTGLIVSLKYQILMDYTGEAIMLIKDLDDIIITQRSANLKINIPLASSTNNIGGVLSGIGTVVAGVASMGTGNILGGAMAAVSGIASAASAIQPRVQITGASNGSAMYWCDSYAISEFHFPCTEDNDNNGRPLCKPVTLNQLSGFTMCKNADVVMSGTPGERSKVIGFLERGFYIE